MSVNHGQQVGALHPKYYLAEGGFGSGDRATNLVILFLADSGPAVAWGPAPPDEIAAECEDREMEVVHFGKKSPDVVLRLPEGTKTWETRIGFEKAWRAVTSSSPVFIARSAKAVVQSYIMGEEIYASLGVPKKGSSAGLVFLETRGLEQVLESECDRLLKVLGMAGEQDLIARKHISRGDILVVKRGKDGEPPAFARVARIIQECYRSVLEKPVHVAGRSLKTLKGIRDVIEEYAPKMLAEVGQSHGSRRMTENGGLA